MLNRNWNHSFIPDFLILDGHYRSDGRLARLGRSDTNLRADLSKKQRQAEPSHRLSSFGTSLDLFPHTSRVLIRYRSHVFYINQCISCTATRLMGDSALVLNYSTLKLVYLTRGTTICSTVCAPCKSEGR